jgi:branched-chain amino acid transport system ATP-binding protein
VTDLVVRYGSAIALDHASLTVGRGERVALIGPNGAGKSTLANVLSGVVQPSSGAVEVRGRLAHAPEGRQVFADLTVDDNLQLGGWRIRNRDTAPIYALLPALVPLRRRRAGSLSGGQQQMVSIGRALMARPEVLVVDELSLGLAPIVVSDLAQHLRQLDIAVLLIEQNARLALDLCARAYVLEAGRIVAEGDAPTLARSTHLAQAYLGS